MARLTPLHLIPALLAAAAHAGEITIEQRPFFVEKSLAAVVLPEGDGVALKLEPKAWADFKIIELAAHGRNVSKGELLIRFETRKLDEKITDLQASHATNSLLVAKATAEYQHLLKTTALQLEIARRVAETAAEENRYFSETRRQSTADNASQNLKRYEQMLANQREELKQLKQMYEADEVTENTEEIILVRQQDSVAAAEFALRMEMLEHQRTLSVTLPREAKMLDDSVRESTLALAKIETEAPRSIELKKLELTTLETTFARETTSLAELTADRNLCEFKAPAEGIFYYGPIENGHWLTADATKLLQLQTTPPTQRVLATFVPKTATLALVSFLDEATQRSLTAGLSGSLILAGREDLEIPVKLQKIATVPSPDGNYRADFSVVWPAEMIPPIGSNAEIRLISYHQPATIAVPNKTLTFDPLGWSVEVKLADGKTARRPVKRGRSNKDETEILAGLEIGQVVIAPQ